MIPSTLAAASDTDWAIITDLAVILASAAVVAVVMQRMRLAAIPAYLIAGAVIGPRALGLVPSPEGLGAISHLAIILLLFGIGLELHLSVLKHRLARMIAVGFGSCLLSIVVGWPIAIWFGLAPPAALAVSMALALSSTALVMRIIADRRELGRMRGRLALSILVIQDMIVLGMLAAIPALAAWAGSDVKLAADPDGQVAGDGGTLQSVVEALLRVGGVAVLIVLGRVILPRVLRESFKGRSLEVMTLSGVAAALLAAVVAQGIGFSLEMGAFLAGFMLAGTPFRHQLGGQIGPLRDIFIAVFFTTLGMKLNPSILAEWWWVIIAGGALMMVLKSALISGVCWALGTTASIAIAVGFSLAQAGEFSLIVLDTAHGKGIIDDATTATAIAIVVISLILTPALVELGGRLARVASKIGTAPWVKSSPLRDPSHALLRPPNHATHVIIAGYGPIGCLIAEELERAGISYTVVELNPATVQEQSHHGRPIIFGDVGNLEVLESAGIGNAHALVLTIPDEEAVLRTCAVARQRAPDIFIVARTRVVSKRVGLVEVGANSVTVDETSAAAEMLRAVMACIDAGAEEEPLGTEPESDVHSVSESCDEDE
ncbi:MAG: cation:proton antiporter domain-containing protein [Planctomycetota bacterium]|jgi:CPA2 family monovalent cation:H+ antiporter-2